MEAKYCIGIDFERRSPNPTRVFRSTADLIDCFESLDRGLLLPLQGEITQIYLLEDIQPGSLRTWITARLDQVDDSALNRGDWKAFAGPFLLAAKTQILLWLGDQKSIENKKQLDDLVKITQEVAQSTGLSSAIGYVPPRKEVLIRAVLDIKDAIEPLADNDEVYYEASETRVKIASAFEVDGNSIRELLGLNTICSKFSAIVQVKKPDFLGKSRWIVRLHGHAVEAALDDISWLEEFQRRSIALLPGDAIEADFTSEIDYDDMGNVVHEKYRIVKISRVIPAPTLVQGRIVE